MFSAVCACLGENKALLQTSGVIRRFWVDNLVEKTTLKTFLPSCDLSDSRVWRSFGATSAVE